MRSDRPLPRCSSSNTPWRLLGRPWLSVAALSFEAAAADPVVLDPRIHSEQYRPGQAAVAARMRELLDGLEHRRPRPGPLRIQDPYPFRAQPQVDGAVHNALMALEETVGHELNFAGENALIITGENIALPTAIPMRRRWPTR